MKFIILSSIATVLLYGCLYLADRIVAKSKQTGKSWWKRHICDKYPYNDRM